jgi:exosortase D (VPLPA-CTERM-specific)
METTAVLQGKAWMTHRLGWFFLGLIGLSLGFIFYDGLKVLVQHWNAEEYSHGYLIPFISAFFIWEKKEELARSPVSGGWVGLLVCLLGIALYFLGELSTLYIIIHYSLIVVLASLVLAFFGWNGFRLLWAPLLLLVFMIPLPAFLYNNLSQQLQLLSSALGVEVIRQFGVSVFLEGNVIDLGNYKLQVVEACNGLRYLFPLMSFGFICAYLFHAPFWQRTVVFLSTIPLTVLMNSFRIGVIGVLMEHWGTEQAEGFLHYFEGWVIFMV